jgi:hypothetical protein
MGRSERSTKLLEDAALAHRVFGIIVDRTGFVEMVPVASMILRMQASPSAGACRPTGIPCMHEFILLREPANIS